MVPSGRHLITLPFLKDIKDLGTNFDLRTVTLVFKHDQFQAHKVILNSMSSAFKMTKHLMLTNIGLKRKI